MMNVNENVTKKINDNFFTTEQMFRFALGFLLEFTTPANPNNEIGLVHNLGRVPTEYTPSYSENGCVLMPGTSAWTDRKIYFKGSIANSLMKVRIR